ncbi:S41 family peptidase [Magnetovibrio sp.]|uniref:S41 family peptidase n=1 Tax=Magnetovibrio sp. TaxID=2024836 RepID=UPI002F9474A4
MLGLTAMVGLGACTTGETSSLSQQRPVVAAEALVLPPPSVPDTAANTDFFQYLDARTTIRAGLRGIAQRYIDLVDMDVLALNGIRGLATIDPALQIGQEDGMIRLILADQNVADFARPLSADPAAWARLTTDIIRAGRHQSADLLDADNERVYEALFDGMLAGLDVFSRYSGAEEARANRARRDGFGGIGIRFTKTDDTILITHVQEDSPAHTVGLRPGDLILKVGEDATAAMSLRQVAQHLRGPVGSPLTLSIARLDSDVGRPDRQISFNLNRAHIVPETVRASVEDDLLKLTVSGFNKNTSTSMLNVLRKNDEAFQSGRLKGVVMDLRGNPGGLLSQSVSVADLFLNQGRIISTRGRHPDSFHDYRAGGADLIDGKPLIVLVDGDSASAAEIVASALQDLGRAVVIGSSSYGKGTVQTVIRLPNDGEMTLTWSRLVSPSGYALHGLGVMPAVCATNTPIGDTAAILALDHIDGQLEAMSSWRAAGMIFDGRRPQLRDSCPAKTFQADKNGDLLMQLASRVIHDPSLYQRALLQPEPINTASRR